jgi:hypothetical protein
MYCDVLRKMCGKSNWRSSAPEVVFSTDIALAHFALSVREFLANNCVTVVPHPLYSPHLAPLGFVFSKTQISTARMVFHDVSMTQVLLQCSEYRALANASNYAFAGVTVSNYKGNTWKGRAWIIR